MSGLRRIAPGETGLSLLETVIALFLLVFGILLGVNLFQVGLGYSGRVEQSATASLIAQKRIAELRAWSNTPVSGGFNFDDWSGYTNTPQPDPDQPGYTVSVAAQPVTLGNPSTLEESIFPLASQRPMIRSFEKVTVTVNWGGGDPRKSFALTSLIGDPIRQWKASNPVVITLVSQAGNPLPRGLDATFSVQGFDSDNRAIPDLMFSWYVVPRSGNGTITAVARTGSRVTFTHKIRRLNGTFGFCPGPSTCGLMARAVFRGEERTANVVVNLGP